MRSLYGIYCPVINIYTNNCNYNHDDINGKNGMNMNISVPRFEANLLQKKTNIWIYVGGDYCD